VTRSLRSQSRLGHSVWPILLLVVASRAGADDARRESPRGEGVGFAAALQYVIGEGDDAVRPLVSIGKGMSPGNAPPSGGPLSLRYKLDVGAAERPETRPELARSLLLPGAIGLTLGVTHDWSNAKGTRVLIPEVSVGAKVVPWQDDTTAVKVGISGGLGFSASRVFDASIKLTRAVNAIGNREQTRLLAASGTADLWASDVAITAGLQSPRRRFGVYGAFGAYLFDSKFHVPRDGRRVVSVGVRKAFS
jgi:hypothetical protein